MPALGRTNVRRRHKTHDLQETASHKVRQLLSVVDVADHVAVATASAPQVKAVLTTADHKIKNAPWLSATPINLHANPKSETHVQLRGQRRRGQ
jgi:hypothetical protein